jgi:hypothetical protein
MYRMPRRWQDVVTLLLGAWFFLAPWVLETETLSSWGSAHVGNSWWTGAAIVVVAAILLSVPRALWLEGVNAVIAAWVFISPWVLGYAGNTRAAWDAWVVGIIVCALSLWVLATTRRTPIDHLDRGRRIPSM